MPLSGPTSYANTTPVVARTKGKMSSIPRDVHLDPSDLRLEHFAILGEIVRNRRALIGMDLEDSDRLRVCFRDLSW